MSLLMALFLIWFFSGAAYCIGREEGSKCDSDRWWDDDAWIPFDIDD